MKIHSHRTIKGFTLVEILLVVGFIALASIGIYVIYEKVSTSYTAQQEAREMSAIAAGAVQMMNSTNQPITIDATFLSNTSIVPAARLSNGVYVSIMGSPVTFSTVYNNNLGEFQISYDAMVSKYCSKMVAAFEPSVDYLSVNGTVVKNTNPTTTPVNYDVSTGAAACAADASFPFIVQFRK